MDTKLYMTFAQVVAEQFDDYVHAEVLFYPVGAMNGMQMPQLTIGAWLQTQWHLSQQKEGAAVLEKARTEVHRVRSRATELYTTKARREFRSRLDSWTMYVDDVMERKSTNGAGYNAQAHLRLKLELLKEDVSQTQDQLTRLNTLDLRLKTKWQDGAFIFEPELQPAAPKPAFWWLYGGLI